MKCRECKSKNVSEKLTTEEWDFWYTEYKCNKCGATFLIGDLKNPPTNPDTNPVKPEAKKVTFTR
jgi:DNA-directed RNA polymerase subunit RPC12/RpoP